MSPSSRAVFAGSALLVVSAINLPSMFWIRVASSLKTPFGGTCSGGVAVAAIAAHTEMRRAALEPERLHNELQHPQRRRMQPHGSATCAVIVSEIPRLRASTKDCSVVVPVGRCGPLFISFGIFSILDMAPEEMRARARRHMGRKTTCVRPAGRAATDEAGMRHKAAG